jgi:hypothetical protein
MPYREGQPTRQGEKPLEYMTRHGFTVHVFGGFYRAQKKTSDGERREVEDTSLRDVAARLGWTG